MRCSFACCLQFAAALLFVQSISSHCLGHSPEVVPFQATAVCSSRFEAPSAGVYTFSFRRTAPARTITAASHSEDEPHGFGYHAQPGRAGRTYEIAEHPYWAVVTKTCAGPTTIDFTTTLTTTITWTATTYVPRILSVYGPC